MSAREKVAMALQAAEADCLERGEVMGYSVLADAAIDAHLEALKADGYAVVKLPESPSEYWGPAHQPQWNHYPFTRVDGDQVEIGARSEHVFRINVAEARVFAADVLAAADIAEAAAESNAPKCSSCRRERTLADVYDYNPLQVITGQPLGWYSGDDGEVCPECMTRIVGGQ